MKRLTLHCPVENELEYRRQLIADEETMSYNIGFGDDGGCTYHQIPEQVREWYKNWNKDTDNFYAYIENIEDNNFVGEVNIHYSVCYQKYIVGIVIEAKYRGRNYAVEALRLLADHAFTVMKLDAIYDDFSSERKAADTAFSKAGFIRISDKLVELTRKRYLNESGSKQTN